MTPLILKSLIIPLVVVLTITGAACIPLRHHSLAWHRRRRSILWTLAAGILHR